MIGTCGGIFDDNSASLELIRAQVTYPTIRDLGAEARLDISRRRALIQSRVSKFGEVLGPKVVVIVLVRVNVLWIVKMTEVPPAQKCDERQATEQRVTQSGATHGRCLRADQGPA